MVFLKDYGPFTYEDPHPYMAAGAPYPNGQSPFMLRKSIAERLHRAQARLQEQHPGWHIKIFDAYRPVDVQAYMVAFSFIEFAHQEKLDPLKVSEEKRDELLKKVYRIWGPPNRDPSTPPLHSCGAAFDCTLTDEQDRDVDMGSPIDLNSEESNPDYFKDRNPKVHANRLILRNVLAEQGLVCFPNEWWHYSYGDQLWAWLKREQGEMVEAIYGRVAA